MIDNESTLFNNINEIYSVSELTKLIKVNLEEEFSDIAEIGRAHV